MFQETRPSDWSATLIYSAVLGTLVKALGSHCTFIHRRQGPIGSEHFFASYTHQSTTVLVEIPISNLAAKYCNITFASTRHGPVCPVSQSQSQPAAAAEAAQPEGQRQSAHPHPRHHRAERGTSCPRVYGKGQSTFIISLLFLAFGEPILLVGWMSKYIRADLIATDLVTYLLTSPS